MNIKEVISSTPILIQNYVLREGFEFKRLTRPADVFDALVMKNPSHARCSSPRSYRPARPLDEQIELVNRLKIEKAIIVADDISFIDECPTLKYLHIIPPDNFNGNLDFSPLYKLPEVKYLNCVNHYGERGKIKAEIDYSKINKLEDVDVKVNEATINFNKIEKLKSLGMSEYKGYDLQGAFCSSELDTLSLIQCGIRSIDGIEKSNKMQCLYMYYNRSLSDISALSKVGKTLKILRIDNCPKIEDFSVLERLENLELLSLSGKNVLPSLAFINSLKKLKTFCFSMNVLDGDLSPCLRLSYAYSARNRSHFNIKDKDLPKGLCARGNENIEEWRRLE